MDGPSPVPLSQYLVKLSDVCLSVDVKRVNFNISVNTVHKSVPSRTPVTTLVVTPLPSPPPRVSFVASGTVLSASKHKCAASVKQIEAVFDKNQIVLVAVSVM